MVYKIGNKTDNTKKPIILEIFNFAKDASRTGSRSTTGGWKMRKFGNEKMRSELQEKRQRRELTLPKFQTLAKCIPLKVIYLSYRKETEKNGREEGGFLVKKGWKMGGVSL